MKRGSRYAILIAFLCGLGACSNGRSPTGVVHPVEYPWHHGEPAWSSGNQAAYRDNGIICVRQHGAYLCDTARAGIWILDLKSGSKRRLVPNGHSPDWSADGRWLAFELAGRIFITPADSADYRAVTQTGRSFTPRWDPTSDRIAFDSDIIHKDATYTIHVARSDGTGLRALGGSGGGDWRMPAWSPDGLRIAHIRYPGGATFSSEIFSMDTTGADPFRLTTDNATDRSPPYSPDGSRIAFDRQDGQGVYQVWVMNIDGTAQRQLTFSGGASPAWSPDGREVLFVREDWRSNSPKAGVLWIVDTSSGAERQVTYRWPESCP